jgi:hypothetical protein
VELGAGALRKGMYERVRSVNPRKNPPQRTTILICKVRSRLRAKRESGSWMLRPCRTLWKVVEPLWNLVEPCGTSLWNPRVIETNLPGPCGILSDLVQTYTSAKNLMEPCRTVWCHATTTLLHKVLPTAMDAAHAARRRLCKFEQTLFFEQQQHASETL